MSFGFQAICFVLVFPAKSPLGSASCKLLWLCIVWRRDSNFLYYESLRPIHQIRSAAATSNIFCFFVSCQNSNLRPHRCERCVLTLCMVLRDQLNYKTLFCALHNVSIISNISIV